MEKTLCAWTGNADLAACRSKDPAELGPVAQAVTNAAYSQLMLLSNFDARSNREYTGWLRDRSSARVQLVPIRLNSPTNFAQIYEGVIQALVTLTQSAAHELTFHLSPGTPAMAAVWILVACTRFPARLIESSREKGVKEVAFPFDIAADYRPPLAKISDKTIVQIAMHEPPAIWGRYHIFTSTRSISYCFTVKAVIKKPRIWQNTAIKRTYYVSTATSPQSFLCRNS